MPDWQRLGAVQALQEAKELITGGSSSPVRLWTTLGGKPFFAARAKGAHVWDVDGNRCATHCQVAHSPQRCHVERTSP